MRRQGAFHCEAFHLLWLNGRDLRMKPLTERSAAWSGCPDHDPLLSQVLTVPDDWRALFEAVQRLDLQAIVAKRKADAYRPETVWYKIKSRTYTQGEGRWELFQKR